MDSPVVLIIFNRPERTRKVFEQIRKVKPSKLLIVADGPRVNQSGEAEKCAAARTIVDEVDWDCEILKNYSEINMGCGRRVSSGLDWVFDTVEEAIILEDDCLPHPTFFYFCSEILERYRHDERVMHIAGTNILGEWKSNIQSYHFSYSGIIWGWASWRRAWQYYDFDMSLWSDFEVRKRVRDVMGEENYAKAEKIFESVYQGNVDTWDIQWRFSRLTQSGLSVIPAVNLISNIGFGEDATHTTSKANKEELAELRIAKLEFPIELNEIVAPDRDFDKFYFRKRAKKPKLFSKLKSKLHLR